MSAFGDGYPDPYRPQEPFYAPYGPVTSGEPVTEPHVPQHRRASRLVMAIGAGVVALAVVGAVAFGGSLLLGRTSSNSPVAGAAASSSTDPGAAGDGGPSATEAATASPTGAPKTSAAPTKAAQATPPAKPKTTGAPLSGNAAYEAQVLTIVNSERAKAGCKALAYNAKLTTAARKHSADMAARNYFSHNTPEGVDFATRITNEGYRWSGAAENIAKGQRTPEDVMNAWMNSSGHRANILNCGLKDLGVGLAYQGKTPIWTQDFGSPR